MNVAVANNQQLLVQPAPQGGVNQAPAQAVNPAPVLANGVAPANAPQQPGVARGRDGRRQNGGGGHRGGMQDVIDLVQNILQLVPIPNRDQNNNNNNNNNGGGGNGDGGGVNVGNDVEEAAFIVAQTPNVQCLMESHTKNAFYEYNCMGSPYCGMVSIDVALGITPDLKAYNALSREFGRVEVGEREFLKQYAWSRNVNLVIWVEYTHGGLKRELKFEYTNMPTHKYIHLVLRRMDGGIPRRDDLFDGNNDPIMFQGHYYLCTRVNGDYSNLELPKIVMNKTDHDVYVGLFMVFLAVVAILFTDVIISSILISEINSLVHSNNYSWLSWIMLKFHLLVMSNQWWLTPLKFFVATYICFDKKVTFLYGAIRLNPSNDDVRAVRDRRDKASCNDHYQVVIKRFGWRFLTIPIYSFEYSKYIVSVVRAVQAIKEIQLVPEADRVKVGLGILRLNIANTNDSISNIYADTNCYVNDWLKYSKISDSASFIVRTVAYNANGITSYVPNMNAIKTNQEGLFEGNHNAVFNGIRFQGGFMKKLKRNIVAYSPVKGVFTDLGQLGPGNVCVTDPYSLIAAFVGRSMSSPVVSSDEDVKLMGEFLDFGKSFLDRHIDSVDLDGISEEDPCKYFEELYYGKRSVAWIKNMVESYRLFEKGLMNNDFNRCSCFVKLEDSTKVVDGEARVRPRLIMTMSNRLLIEMCQIMKLISRWNDGSFKEFQVKHMEVDDFIRKVEHMSERNHTVTDYSSFEGSIFGRMRELEHHVISRLCGRANMPNTLKVYEEVALKPRRLYTNMGLVFRINSRCSGDFVTSFGNGIVNVCLMAFCAFKNGADMSRFTMIAEGDDGLSDPTYVNVPLLKQLGFKFSSELLGFLPGDVDFLRRRWMGGLCYLNVGRVLKNIFWVLTTENLSFRKQMAILRCKGLSLHYSSPGHPILYEIVNRIERLTRGFYSFKGIQKWVSNYNHFGVDVDENTSYPRSVGVNEQMRLAIAEGAMGFPPIPYVVQLELERRIRDDEYIYIGSLLDEYDDIMGAKLCEQWKSNEELEFSSEMLQALDIIGVKPELL
jgi:hypothetical protein